MGQPKTGRFITCYCGKQRWCYPYEIKKEDGKYCSRSCANKANAKDLSIKRQGSGNPMFGKKPWNFNSRGLYKVIQKTSRVGKYKNRVYKNGNKGLFKKGHKIWVGKKLSEEHKDKLRIKHSNLNHLTEEQKVKFLEKGKKHRFLSGNRSNNWRGGVTPENALRLVTWKWLKIAKEVRKRDSYTCQIMECNNKAYSVHHIIPWRITKNDSLDNLVTLCSSCHSKVEQRFIREGVVFYGTHT